MMNFFHEVYDKQNDKYCHIACICQNHKNLSMKRNVLNLHAEIAVFQNVFTNYYYFHENITCKKERKELKDLKELKEPKESLKELKIKNQTQTQTVIPQSNSSSSLLSYNRGLPSGLCKRTLFSHLYKHLERNFSFKHIQAHSQRNIKNKSRKYTKDAKCANKQDSIRNCTLYVIRCNSEGSLVNSKPCYHCLHFLKKSQKIKRIVYSDENGQLISTPLHSLHNTHITRGNLMFLNSLE